ncbi:MAG: hypothetical protein RL005_1632, partial [Planctomycetota bacterium]
CSLPIDAPTTTGASPAGSVLGRMAPSHTRIPGVDVVVTATTGSDDASALDGSRVTGGE